jgi:hypothetical protein
VRPARSRPGRLVRSGVASRARRDDCGPMRPPAAWERNCFGAARRAVVGDGLPVNGTIPQRHFAPFTPVRDCGPALSYGFAAAVAGRSPGAGEAVYWRWVQGVWSGEVATIRPEVAGRSAALGAPPADCPDRDPRRLVSEAWRSLRNNAERMHSDASRRAGLPIRTSAVASVIKLIHRRVKGSAKFGSEGGAEAIVPLRADSLSETNVVSRFWSARAAQAQATRPDRKAI